MEATEWRTAGLPEDVEPFRRRRQRGVAAVEDDPSMRSDETRRSRRATITTNPRYSNARRSPLDGAEHGRRMHVPAGPISSDRNTLDRSCLPLPLVSARDRDRAC